MRQQIGSASMTRKMLYNHNDITLIGYHNTRNMFGSVRPEDLTVHPTPRICRGWVHFFAYVSSVFKNVLENKIGLTEASSLLYLLNNDDR